MNGSTTAGGTGIDGAAGLGNAEVRDHPFLTLLYDDPYFPDRLLDRARRILLDLCARIEREDPADLGALYVLTHAATEEFNDLQVAFEAAGSEFETVAREEIAEGFWFIATAYGFADADVEELMAPRDW